MSDNTLQQSELWEISRQLVSFDTVSSSSNVQAAEYLANLLENIGFSVRLIKEQVQNVEKAMVLAWIGPEVPGGLILSGHIDIVPFDGQPGWTTDPLTISTDGQRIFGRGVTDMKVFLAQAILAAKQQPLEKLKRPLVYIFTCDEELAGQGAERLVEVLPDLFRNYPLPNVALIGEPTNFSIFPAHKGYAVFDIRIHGKGGHSSAPHKGLNAIEKMGDVIQLIKETNTRLQQQVLPENRTLFPESPATVLNCGVIMGGLAANMIAETCRLTASMRIAPGDDGEAIVRALQQRIENEIAQPMRTAVSESGIFFENMIAAPPMRSAIDNPFCELLCRIMGKQANQGAPFATDGGHFQQLGIQSYICGPGLLEEAHQPNESIPVSNFLTGLTRLKQVISEWCMA